MLTPRLPLYPQDTLSEKVNKKFLYGYKGWLFIITATFLLIALYQFKYLTSSFGALVELHDAPVLLLWTGLQGVAALLSLAMACLLYFRPHHSLLAARGCLILIMIVGIAAHYLFGDSHGDVLYTLRIMLPSIIFYSLILLYLSVSRRVRNTFMFVEATLPRTIRCPFCYAAISPNEQERVDKEVTCPKCSELISQATIVANVAVVKSNAIR